MMRKATTLMAMIASAVALPAIAQAGMVLSEGQVASQLQAEGYSDIAVSPIIALYGDPRPERTFPESREALANAPAHVGWNGRATAPNGERVDVYVGAGGQVSARS